MLFRSEPAPLFREVRELILRKCRPDKAAHVRAIFEKQPFGELERLVAQRLLDVAEEVAKAELENEYWLRMVAELSGRSFEEMRVIVLEFLDTNVFQVSNENCVAFLNPVVESWDVDFDSFRLDIILNMRLVPHPHRVFQFVEVDLEGSSTEYQGLTDFLNDMEDLDTSAPAEVLDQSPEDWGELVIARSEEGDVLYIDPQLYWEGVAYWFRARGDDPHRWRGNPSGLDRSGRAALAHRGSR